MVHNNLVKIKEHPPYTLEQEDKVLLNSVARASPDAKDGSYTFKAKAAPQAPTNTANVSLVSSVLTSGSLSAPSAGDFVGVGVDQGKEVFITIFTMFLTGTSQN